VDALREQAWALHDFARGESVVVSFTDAHGTSVGMHLQPIYPHGQTIASNATHRMARTVNVAPPRPQPEVNEPAGDDLRNGLIEEARRRARRRRWMYGGAVVVVAIAAVAASSILAGPPSPTTPLGTSSPPPAAPLARPPDDAGSTLIASWAQFHVGYSNVYADGRVIWETDATYKAGDPYAWTRRLNTGGLDLVRSGALTAEDFARGDAPSHVWADADAAGWAASEHAVCLWQESADRRGPFRDATHRLDELPAPAQALLRGPRRTFPGDGFQPSSACFVLTPQDARAVLDLNGPNPWRLNDGPGVVEVIPASLGEGAVVLMVHAILPHGDLLFWGG
jgi:hypothetical protein